MRENNGAAEVASEASIRPEPIRGVKVAVRPTI